MNYLSYEVECFGLSDIGLVRSNNEDVFRVLPEQHFYILADGMGGHNAGEVAAFQAVESMCASMEQYLPSKNIEQICNQLREAIETANTSIHTLSIQNKDYSGMGTTLSCFVLHEDKLIYAHVGDSRLYRKRQRLEQLTEDHSLRHLLHVNEDRESTSLPSLPYRNVITKAIGTHQHLLPDIGVISMQAGDIYLLCSDGLTDTVSEESISKILNPSKSLNTIASELIYSALKNGGNDNITVLLVKISDEKSHLPR